MVIGKSKHFHSRWEELQKALTQVLSEAHNENGKMDDWNNAIGLVQAKIDNLNAFGWSVKQGFVKE